MRTPRRWLLATAAVVVAAGCGVGPAPDPAVSPRASFTSRPAQEQEVGDGRGCLRLTVTGPEGGAITDKIMMLRLLTGLGSSGEGNDVKDTWFELIPGEWDVDIQVRRGYGPAIFSVPIRAGECTLASVVLDRAEAWRHLALPPRPGFGILEGRALGPAGPLPAEEVAWSALPQGRPSGAGFTDADGRYRFHLRPGRYDILFLGPGEDSADLEVAAGRVTVHDLRAEEP